MVTKAPPKPDATTDPAPPDDDEPVTLAKVVEIVKETVSDLLGGNKPPDKAPESDPLDQPVTVRELEAFAARQMRGEQDKIKGDPKPPPAPKDEAGDKPPDPKPDPHIEQAPQVKPGWREKLWS